LNSFYGQNLITINEFNTVIPRYNDHSREFKSGAVVDRWSLLRGSFMLRKKKLDTKMAVAVGNWSLFEEVVVSSSSIKQFGLDKGYFNATDGEPSIFLFPIFLLYKL